MTLNFQARLRDALAMARNELLAARTQDGHWIGELSSSALSTATAVCALAVVEKHDPSLRTPHSALRIQQGLDWLARHLNADGGWGDTPLSLSNISTTTLCWAAFGVVAGADGKYRAVVKGAQTWLTQRAGGTGPDQLAPAIVKRYGKDRTFSAPILTTCALSGRLGSGTAAWKWVLQLPFELAAMPHQFFAALRLPVVSYALPALIAIGQARHHHLPSRNPFARFVRNLTRERTLKVLTDIQPSSGGFLEATPLTSFVVMSLAGSGQVNHLVTKRGVEFLLASAREDGAWPIDTNLATWVTTLSVNALASGSAAASAAPVGARSPHEPPSSRREEAHSISAEGSSSLLTSAATVQGFNAQNLSGQSLPKTPVTAGTAALQDEERRATGDWLLKQQYRKVHPYTYAAAGGWAWTDLPGGVPDADDTAGALLALRNLSVAAVYDRGDCGETRPSAVTDRRYTGDPLRAAVAGINWLLDLQNSDGGIPTFCRGWTNLPFDRSAPDLTAHALRAWNAWLPKLPEPLQRRVRRGMDNGLRYLARTQRPDGAWLPLWFGNQHTPDETNPVYGTARVLIALADLVGQASCLSQSDGSNSRPLAGERTKSFETGRMPVPLLSAMARGATWLLSVQKSDGSWGAPGEGPSSVEETALAVEALAALAEWNSGPATCRPSRVDGRDAVSASLTLDVRAVRDAAMKGANWLIEKVENGSWRQPSPIGFYFAKLWYYERLYPQIFTVAALSKVASTLTPQTNLSGLDSWVCPACGEKSEGQFSSCWKCGADRSADTK